MKKKPQPVQVTNEERYLKIVPLPSTLSDELVFDKLLKRAAKPKDQLWS